MLTPTSTASDRPAAVAAVLVLVASAAARGLVVELPSRTIEQRGVTVEFPAVTYRGPDGPVHDPVATAAAIASEALGARVDPERDRVVVTGHRVVLKDPTDRRRLLKLYRADTYDARRIARNLQRDLAFETYLRGLGLRVAAIDRDARLLERGVLRQERIDGTPLSRRYPRGYPAGANAAVDRMLAQIAAVDTGLMQITTRQSGLLMSNTVDCVHPEPVGVDVGACRGNIFLERGTGEPVLIDW